MKKVFTIVFSLFALMFLLSGCSPSNADIGSGDSNIVEVQENGDVKVQDENGNKVEVTNEEVSVDSALDEELSASEDDVDLGELI